ncbi:enhanced serine sensitivity protein SseB C-terminal domain-containing protein [Flavobacterium chuncheonense]|uniref:Enhanced serine sensitivity protein SseB C-terminal domain-containing protein n=1 Tax=Flavobacterium chuncheonense TaxID=2026653 RepID=A0ABW5YIL9_9FLAO
MGILDFFKSKKTENTFPENELERTLKEASLDVSVRNEFYMKLLWNELYVLTNGHQNSEEGNRTLEKDTEVQLVTFKEGEIPVFTSTNRIFDKGIIKNKVPYMAMKGQDLFGLTKGATLILNPYSDYGKELVPQEIESLLNGTIFNETNRVEIKEDTQVLIGQPTEYPKDLVEELCSLFKKEGNVNSAYLAIIKTDKSEDKPSLIVGIETNANMASISGKAGALAEQIIPKGEVINFIKIENNDGISDYFLNQTKPFYKRT